jgi:hypothetical protein
MRVRRWRTITAVTILLLVCGWAVALVMLRDPLPARAMEIFEQISPSMTRAEVYQHFRRVDPAIGPDHADGRECLINLDQRFVVVASFNEVGQLEYKIIEGSDADPPWVIKDMLRFIGIPSGRIALIWTRESQKVQPRRHYCPN